MRLVLGQDAQVAQWAMDKYAGGIPPYLCAMGIVDNAGTIRGAATLHFFNGANVELCYWGPGTLTRQIAGQIAQVCFHGLKACRVTCKTQRDNKIVVRHLPKLGFRTKVFSGTITAQPGNKMQFCSASRSRMPRDC